MCDLDFNAHCKEMFKTYRILTVVGMYIFEICLFVKKNQHIIRQDPVNHKHETRNKALLRPVRHSTALFEKSVSFAGISLFNMLPDRIKVLKTSLFVNRIKKFLIYNPMYDINEFISCDKSTL